jgi:hypothetical protein
MHDRRRAEKRVYCGSVTIFLSAFCNEHGFLFYQQMVTRRRDVYPPFLKSFSVARQLANESFMLAQSMQQRATQILGSHVLHDGHRGGKIGWQLANQLIEDLKASRRSSGNERC